MRSTLLLVALFATACGKEQDRDGDGALDDVDCAPDDPAYFEEVTWQNDGDGDGYGAAYIACEPPPSPVDEGGDCADGDPGRHPGVAETCDGVDEDCSGEADDNAADAIRWSKDNDGDGYGSISGVITACQGPLGYISKGGDCDDRDFAIHPGVDETCDGEDQDCDGEVDEDPIEAPFWYRDADGDGYGSNLEYINACAQPSGYLPGKGDCDDADDLLNPGETEYCNGFDDDCDGLLDKADPGEAGDATWYYDGDADLYGITERTTTSCTWPTGYARRDGDCDDVLAAVNPGEAEVCENGVDDNCDDAAAGCGDVGEAGLSEGAFSTWTGAEAGGLLGFNVGMAPIGDWSGDGKTELAVGAQAGGTGAGIVYFLPGGGTGSVGTAVALTGANTSDAVGYSVAAAGDASGDGVADVLIGAPGVSTLQGAAYLVRGPVTTSGGIEAVASLVLTGPAASQTGFVVASAGDQDDDGLADLLVTANTASAGAGKAYVVAGDLTGKVSLDAGALATVTGGALEGLGWSASAGDLSGDGVADVVLGGPFDADATGQAWMFEGTVSGSVATTDGVVIAAETTASSASFSMDARGDYDGDGYGDLAVGASQWSDGDAGSGRVYVVFGPITADHELSTSDATFDGKTGGFCGYTVAAVGSPNGDDLSDLAIGCALGWDSAAQRGLAYLQYGGFTAANYKIATTGLRFTGEADSDVVGGGVAPAGDQDGDGVDDWIVAAPYNGSGAGKTVVLLGASAF